MWHEIGLLVWFFAPIGFANVAPIFASKAPVIKDWNATMDFGKTYRGVRILGAHKTWRGLISGIIAATLVVWLEQTLVRGSVNLQSFVMPLDYASLPVLIVGPLFAIGTLGGDALKSFFKRQRRIQPGKPWFPFDQIDILGGAITVMPFLLLTFWQYFWLVFVCLFAQIGFSYLGYWVGMKEKPL